MNYGLTQMAQGRYEEADRLFERAAVYAPSYSYLEVNQGIVAGRLGRVADAERHFNRALQLQPNEPSSYTFYARWLIERGRVSEAIPLLERAVQLSPGVVDARYQLLDAYARAGQTAKLVSVARETLAVAPGDPIAMRYVVERASDVQSIARPSVQGADALLITSVARYRAGDFTGSIEAARQALALKPDYAEAHNNIAAGLAALGRWDEAILAAREALRLKPDFPLARNNLAWAEAERARVRPQ
jgi:Flp pilus assembly protein TadD